MNTNPTLQDRAVEAAARFLEVRGYETLATGWKSPETRGTIDLVARDPESDDLVFVDVSAPELRRRLRLVGIVEVQPLGAGAALDGAEDVARVGETELLGSPVGGVVGRPGLQARDGPLAFGVPIVHGGTPTA